MNISVKEIYPKVFKSKCKQKVFVKFNHDEDIDVSLLSIKIQPMEQYSVPHTALYRIDEEERYDYVALNDCGGELYCVEYDFTTEQQYSLKIKYNDKIICWSHLYSLDDDLAVLKAYKGDTHLHSCRSDGEGTPFEVACNYRASGFDFIAITDHHKFAPSLEAQGEIKELTNDF
ncbi:MAG: hypothetical protein IKU82_02890, partial [Clostridia bacterium]|nr:hypothetical protein [Clostridia bacterium]